MNWRNLNELEASGSCSASFAFSSRLVPAQLDSPHSGCARLALLESIWVGSFASTDSLLGSKEWCEQEKVQAQAGRIIK